MKALLLTVLLLLGLSAPAWATTYWVSTTGVETVCANVDGTSDPGVYMTPAQMVTSGCMAASDTVKFKAGTYTTAVNWTSLLPSGTSVAKTIAICETSRLCIIQPTTDATTVHAVVQLNNKNHVRVEGFKIDGTNVPHAATQGIYLEHASGGLTTNFVGVQLVDNWILGHHSNGIAYNIEALTYTHNETLVQRNLIDAPTAPISTASGAPHAFYCTTKNSIIEYNEVTTHANPTANQSFAFHCYRASQGTIIRYNKVTVQYPDGGVLLHSGSSGVQVYGNTFRCTGAAACARGVNITSGMSGVKIYNNTFDQFTAYVRQASDAGTLNQVKNNVCITGASCTLQDDKTPDDLLTATNVTGAATTNFTDRANQDYSLVAGAATLIDQGTAQAGFAYNGSAPDVGAHERFTYSSAVVNENTLDVTLGMNLATPVQPASGLTGFTALVGGVPRTTVSAAKLTGSDAVVRITFNGAVCAIGEVWTVTYASGNATDSRLIGNSSTTGNQPLSAFTAQAVTNGCEAAPPADPGTPHIYYKLDDNTGTNANDESANNLDGTLTNGPTWVTGKHLYGVLMDATNDFIAVPYGSGVNPSTQDLTVCFGVLPTPGSESGTYGIFGAPIGTNQRFFLANIAGTWSQGIQSSTASSNSEWPVAAGWTYLCLVADSGTATLYVNGVAGTSAQSVKAYTSYTLSANLQLGAFSGGSNGSATYDEFKVYTAALSAANITDLYDAWEPPPPAATGTFTQKDHRFHSGMTVNGGVVDIGIVSAAIDVRPGAVFGLTIQTDCTAADCAATAQRLFYSRNSGTFTAVPDLPEMGSDQIAFYTTGGDSTILDGAVACCLSGALTANAGTTNRTAAAIPSYDLAQNASIVQRYVLVLGASAVLTDTYDFKLYHQTGEAFDAYSPAGGARITVSAVLSAPTNLRSGGTTNNTLVMLIWNHVNENFITGYKVYRSTTSGSYGFADRTITWTSAIAAHHALTQYMRIERLANTYYYVVTAIDTGGNESAVSNEIEVVKTGFTARGAP